MHYQEQSIQTGPLKLCGKLIAQQTQQSCSKYRYDYGSSLKQKVPRTLSLDDELAQAKESLQLLKARHPKLTDHSTIDESMINYSILTEPEDQAVLRRRILKEFHTNPYYFYESSESDSYHQFPSLVEKPKIAPTSKFKLIPVISPTNQQSCCRHACDCEVEEKHCRCCKAQSKRKKVEISGDQSETFVIIELHTRRERPNTKLKKIKFVRINDKQSQQKPKPPSQTERQLSRKKLTKKSTHGNVKCPVCNRIFHHSVGDRHVQFCQYLDSRTQQKSHIR